MEFKLVLALVLIACFWLVDGCNRSPRYRRSVETYGTNYSITLQADPCDFATYDANQDGKITEGEFNEVLGISKETRGLFAALTVKTDDGEPVIKPYEFDATAPRIITECFDSNN